MRLHSIIRVAPRLGGWKSACAALCCSLAIAAVAKADAQGLRVVVNGKALPSSAVQVIDEKAYIALRPLAQLLGADIASGEKGNAVTVTTLLRQVVFHIDDRSATINGQRIQLDAPPRKLNSRILIPLRSLGQAFGAAVSYRQADHSAVVTTNPSASPSRQFATPPPLAATRTMNGTVTAVNSESVSPTIQVSVDNATYTVNVPNGTRIEFRDIHGAVTARGYLSQVRPGDALIVTLDAADHLIAIADIFASVTGTIASIAGPAMVLTNGKVIAADPSAVSVTLDGHAATLDALKTGDKVSVRSDPKTGRVRDVVALTPGGFAISATATPSANGPSTGSGVQIKSIQDNADRALRAGQTLRVSAYGTAGGQARFDLSNVIVDNSMRETFPGHYEGQFEVNIGTNLTDAPIIVRLSKNDATAVAEAPDALDILTTPPAVKEIAPGSGQQINAARPNIFAAFTTVGDKGMALDSLRIQVNGQDVTAAATRTAGFISYYPSAAFTSGTVQVEVRGTDIAGNPLRYRWSFIVLGK